MMLRPTINNFLLLCFLVLATISIEDINEEVNNKRTKISNKNQIKFLVQDNGRLEKIKRLRNELKVNESKGKDE